MSGRTIKFEDGAVQFRQRLAVSILSNRPLLIRNIRCDSVEAPGLRDHEASFLRLLDTMTNGSEVEINATGTQLRFRPGILTGGEISHECPNSRSVGWFFEGIICLAPFGKEDFRLSLSGVTDGMSNSDPSPDYLAASIVPLLRRFGVGGDDEGPQPSLSVSRRGAAPAGGGLATLYCPLTREILPINLTDAGKIKRVRGVVVSCRVPPTSASRACHSAKGMLHRLLPDVWIQADAHLSRGKIGGVGGCGASPGLNACLVAESTEGTVLAADTSLYSGNVDGEGVDRRAAVPENLGIEAAASLLEEVRKGGCIDTGAQSIAFLLMCLGPEDVSRIRVGTLSQYTVASLRLFKEAFAVEFKVRVDTADKTVLLSCLGTGYRNMARASS